MLHRQLLRKQLVELEARSTRDASRIVQASLATTSGGGWCRNSDGFAKADRRSAATVVRGQRVGRAPGRPSARVDRACAACPGKPGRRRIDRRQPIGQRRVLGTTVLNLGCTISRPKRPSRTSPKARTRAARRERLLLARIEVEEAQGEHARAVFDVADELAARPVLHVVLDDRLRRAHPAAEGASPMAIEARLVLVAQRQVQHEVELARDAETRELLERCLLDAGKTRGVQTMVVRRLGRGGFRRCNDRAAHRFFLRTGASYWARRGVVSESALVTVL